MTTPIPIKVRAGLTGNAGHQFVLKNKLEERNTNISVSKARTAESDLVGGIRKLILEELKGETSISLNKDQVFYKS